jgi:hypothetical protein
VDNFFMGRVQLDRFEAGDLVVLFDVKGNELYRLTTNNTGVYYTYGPLPSEFRVTARRAGEDTVHSREVRGGYFGGTMYVNPLTTLASRLVQSSPELTLAQAEDRVRAYFKLPVGYDFDWVTNAQISPFRPAVFYAEASQNGGLEAYYQKILVKLQNPALYKEESSAAAALLTTVAGNLFGDTISVLDSGAFGAVTQFFGLNLGTTGAINAVSLQLNQVLLDLSSLEGQLNVTGISGTYNSDRSALAPSINNITAFSNYISNAVQSNGANLDVSALLSADTDLLAVEQFLIGSTVDNIIFTYAEYLCSVENKMALSSTDSLLYQSYPVRINSRTQKLQQNLQIYLNYLVQGLNNRAELAHMQIPVASQLHQALVAFDTATQVGFQANAQVPALLTSDDIVLDMERGEMWSANFQSECCYYDANNIALNWEEGGYDDWRLPPRANIDGFVQSRIGPAKTSDDNGGWQAGFTAFGFGTQNYGRQKYMNNLGRINTDVQGQSFFDQNTNSGALPQNVYQWSGVSDTPATSEYGTYQGDTVDLSTYLIYRPYASTPETLSLFGDPFAYATLPQSGTLTVTVAGSQLSASTALDAKGEVTPIADVTARTYWKSSNTAMATVSNYPGAMLNTIGLNQGPVGQITWHPPIDGSALAPVSFTGTLWGPSYGGGGGQGPQAVSSIQGSITVSPPSGLTPLATSLQVLPWNLTSLAVSNQFDVSGLARGTAAQFDMYATTFYQDGQFHDVTGLATSYALLDSLGNLINSQAQGGGFIDSQKNRLLIYNTAVPGKYTIRAQYTTPTGQPLTGTIAFQINGQAQP